MPVAARFQSERKTSDEPVKCRPAKCRDANTASVTSEASPGTKLMTPRRRPPSSSASKNKKFNQVDLFDGFHSTVLPMSAGAQLRLVPIAVKLKGDTA